MYGNPDELDRIAGEIEKRAESVRTRGTEMNDRARTMRWHSIAAERCRETVEGDKRKLFQAASTKVVRASRNVRTRATANRSTRFR